MAYITPRPPAPPPVSPWGLPHNRMNRRAVIIGITIAMFVVLLVPVSIMFGGFPPWPVIAWFVAIDIFFCVVIWRVRPFNGPYEQPLKDPKPEDWQ